MSKVAASIKRVLERAGFQIMGNEQPIHAAAPATDAAIRTIAGHTMLSRARLVSLADQVAWIVRADLPGALVECGVWKGGGVGMMAATLLSEGRRDRALHLFDSFTDICPPDPAVDGARAMRESVDHLGDGAAMVLKPMAGFYDSVGGHGTIDVCRDLIERRIGYPPAQVHYHPGWFQDTLPAGRTAMGPIAMLRLDGDWHASTKVCLDSLYDQVVPGGIVVIDDYNTYEGCRRAVDEFLADRRERVLMTRVDNGCYFFLKPT